MVFERVGEPFSTLPLELPELRRGELLVEIGYTTICTSDLHSFFGRRSSPTHSILGHEIMGLIVELPREGLKDFYGNDLKIGDRITWSVYAHSCNDIMVKKGMPQKANDLFKYGHEKINKEIQLSGGFATHCHLKEGSTVFKVPQNLTDKEAAPLNCTHATVAGALRLAGSLSGKNILINGVGMLGLSACAMAKELGANKVCSMDIEDTRLIHSREFGADIVLNAKLPMPELLESIKGNGGIDVVIETSGAPVAIENSLKMMNIGGVCVMVGAVYPQREITLSAENMVRRLLTLKGLHNYIHEDLGSAIKFLSEAKNKYPFETLVGKEFPLNQLDAAFNFANGQSCYRVGIYPNK